MPQWVAVGKSGYVVENEGADVTENVSFKVKMAFGECQKYF